MAINLFSSSLNIYIKINVTHSKLKFQIARHLRQQNVNEVHKNAARSHQNANWKDFVHDLGTKVLSKAIDKPEIYDKVKVIILKV